MDGLVSIALAVLILVGWPRSSFAIIGVLSGFPLISRGAWRVALARRAVARSRRNLLAGPSLAGGYPAFDAASRKVLLKA